MGKQLLGAVVAREVAHGIRRMREYRQLTQQELAERMGSHQSDISRLEDPENRAWTVRTLLRVAVALRCRLRIRFEEAEE